MLFAAIANAQNQAMALAADESGGSATTTVTTTTSLKNTAPTVFINAANQWKYIEMKSAGDKVFFTNLDGLSALKVVVTNSAGNELMQMKLSATANAVDCKKLKSGLYFLTLVNENTDQKKAFTLNR